MPITQYLRGEAFEPDHLKAMDQAFIDTCRSLALNHRSPLMNEIVARKIIALAESGMHNPTALYFAARLYFQEKTNRERHEA